MGICFKPAIVLKHYFKTTIALCFQAFIIQEWISAWWTRFSEPEGRLSIAESMQSHWLLRDSQNKALKDAEQPETWVDWRRDHLCDYGDCPFFSKLRESPLENHCSY